MNAIQITSIIGASIVGTLGGLASIITLATYYRGKIKDAQEFGRLLQIVDQLKKDCEENKMTKSELTELNTTMRLLIQRFDQMEKRLDKQEVGE